MLEAVDVAVPAGATVLDKDAELAIAGHVTGTVVGADDQALEGIEVSAYRQVTAGGVTRWLPVGSVQTDASGWYDVGGLAAGTLRLGFHDPSGNHLDEFHADRPTLEQARDIAVAGGERVPVADARLAPASHVTGAVTGMDGEALDAVQVAVYGPVTAGGATSWEEVASASTNTSGSYDVGGLPAGTYRIGFEGAGYAVEYWNDMPTLALAQTVTVGAAATRADIDAALSDTPPPTPTADPRALARTRPLRPRPPRRPPRRPHPRPPRHLPLHPRRRRRPRSRPSCSATWHRGGPARSGSGRSSRSRAARGTCR